MNLVNSDVFLAICIKGVCGGNDVETSSYFEMCCVRCPCVELRIAELVGM